MTPNARPTTTPLGARIREARLAARLTQRALAARSGINAATITMLERGQKEPYPLAIERLAEGLGLDADELYALAGRIPEDLRAYIGGSLDAIKEVRACLDLPYRPSREIADDV